MVETAIQLYTLRNLNEPLPMVLERIGKTDFDGVEFAFAVADADLDAVVDTLDRTGLGVAGVLVGREQLEDSLEETLKITDRLGCDTIGLSWLDPEHFESIEAVEQTADLLTDLGDQLNSHDLRFLYHNHNQEFTDLGDRSAYDLLVEKVGDSVHFELDVGWALAGGHDPVELIERLGERTPLVHMKDTDAARAVPVEIGNGDVDMDACARAAREGGAEWLVYEHDFPDFPVQSLEHGAEALSKLRG